MNRLRNPDRRKVRQALSDVLPPRWKTVPTGCGKRAYPTYEAALHVVCLRRSPYPLRIYQCPECSRWHLTKRKNWEAPT